jgi:catechol 2,3-dioxygenase-like lactoylglutathione lyase family enzyme
MAAQLVGVDVAVADLASAANVYRIVCGIEPERVGKGVRFRLGDAAVRLVREAAAAGVRSIELAIPDLAARGRALGESGVSFRPSGSGLTIPADEANGLAVLLVDGSASEDAPAAARLDHVAVRVADLADAMRRWTAITGEVGVDMGVHPVSNGAFTAARFVLGERMIELIAPVDGVSSAVAERLQSHGEGPAVLALPVEDVDSVRAGLESAGVRVLRQDPHWMVHPKDAGGVLVQLTPRVAH